ncbi:hypothetical protein HMSSN036_13220 [Paenibacillus macerans]|nr:hypothetical protein HMSSN036_13220 [Paenibacillus macerans]
MELNRRELLMQWAEFNERKWGCRGASCRVRGAQFPGPGGRVVFL